MDTFGKRIVHHRKRLGLTQEQLAEKLGVTAQAVSKWENDQSCPDIGTLPLLAEIFGITTDALLGREAPAALAEVIMDEEETKPDFQLRWDAGRKGTLGFAVWVLAVGTLYLLSQLLSWDMSLWDVLWPTGLLVFGLFNLWPKFSFFSTGCVLLGGYFLVQRWLPLPEHLDSGVIWAVVILLFGASLLADALRKPKKGKFYVHQNNKSGKFVRNLDVEENEFEYHASFGEDTVMIQLALLENGEASGGFGEYTVDLTGVQSVSEDCRLELNCSFGEMTVLIPERFAVVSDSTSAFASVEITGSPEETPQGTIKVEANCHFGAIEIKYV
jgi:transcriptional regulator with XRE-family HTH domain